MHSKKQQLVTDVRIGCKIVIAISFAVSQWNLIDWVFFFFLRFVSKGFCLFFCKKKMFRMRFRLSVHWMQNFFFRTQKELATENRRWHVLTKRILCCGNINTGFHESGTFWPKFQHQMWGCTFQRSMRFAVFLWFSDYLFTRLLFVFCFRFHKGYTFFTTNFLLPLTPFTRYQIYCDPFRCSIPWRVNCSVSPFTLDHRSQVLKSFSHNKPGQ